MTAGCPSVPVAKSALITHASLNVGSVVHIFAPVAVSGSVACTRRFEGTTLGLLAPPTLMFVGVCVARCGYLGEVALVFGAQGALF